MLTASFVKSAVVRKGEQLHTQLNVRHVVSFQESRGFRGKIMRMTRLINPCGRPLLSFLISLHESVGCF